MATYIVSNVSLLPQDKSNACWYFSAKMLADWSQNHSCRKACADPSTVKELEGLYQSNAGYDMGTGKDLAKKLGLTAQSRQSRGYNEMLTLLKNGPIWCSGFKGGTNGFPHAVTIAGVADTGVLVYDPLPLNTGSKSWKTWTELDTFMALSDSSIDANLLTL